jgi:transcriptional regulator with XRE-family HTH domain
MPAGDSPTVARRRVRLALREAREAAGMTQTDVAEAMEWSLSKVIRIESGEVSIAQNDLRYLLSHLGVTEPARVTDLLEDAKVARTRQRAWWQEPKYREHLTAPLRRLIEFEGDAVAIRFFYIYQIPGPLQIPEYAMALTSKWDELSQEQIERRVEARRLRREMILARRDLRLWVLLDESVLRRPIGGPRVFAEQLRELVRVGRQPHVDIRMVPFDVEAVMSNNGGYDLLYLSEDGKDEDAVMYRETGPTDEILEDSTQASRHRERYEKIWHAALNESDTIDFIQERLEIVEKSAGQSTTIHT